MSSLKIPKIDHKKRGFIMSHEERRKLKNNGSNNNAKKKTATDNTMDLKEWRYLEKSNCKECNHNFMSMNGINQTIIIQRDNLRKENKSIIQHCKSFDAVLKEKDDIIKEKEDQIRDLHLKIEELKKSQNEQPPKANKKKQGNSGLTVGIESIGDVLKRWEKK